jgi:hypothetical protein
MHPHCLCFAVVLVAFLSTLSAPARAADPVDLAIAPAANDCAKWLKGRKQMVVCIGAISGPQTYPTSGGPGIRLVLTRLLGDRGIEVRERATIALRVEYKGKEVADPRDSKRTRLTLSLRVVFVDQREAELADVEWRVDHEEAVRVILGITGDRAGKFDREADRALAVGFFEPKAYFDGGVVLAGEKSPFGMELLLNAKPVVPQDRDGLAYAPIPRGQEYQIRLVNRSDREMAVRLSIDGLNAFTFCEQRQPEMIDGKPNPRKGQPLYDLILVPAKGEVTVPGWVINAKKALGFKVTEYPRTAVAQLGRDDLPAGTITATFSAAWTGAPPADEPPMSRGPGDDGTGLGSPKEIDAKPVERKVGVVRASVSLRYTTKQ